jgi:hypothetical protein
MHDLSEAMHAGIGTAGNHRLQGRLRKFQERPFERVLNRLAVRLLLPAAKGRAVVLDS